MTKITDKDIQQLTEKGIALDTVKRQIETFKDGIPFVHLEKAAVVSDGILKFSAEEEEALANDFIEKSKDKSLLKFVPASGAASRMFKALFNFLEAYEPSKESFETYIKRTGDTALEIFFRDQLKLPFYVQIHERIKDKITSEDEGFYLFVKEMLLEEGLNYGFYPKGLLPFHGYGTYSATPFEEHLKEAAMYSKSKGKAQLHFTISEQHEAMFAQEFEAIEDRVSKATATQFEVTYSFQKPATDTIAVDMENEPFRNGDGSLLFRPGGHGALIENLNERDADVIFIKNIDNVVVPKSANAVAHSKMVLAGLLLRVQQQVFAYAKQLEDEEVSRTQVQEIKKFLETQLNVRFSENFEMLAGSDQRKVLADKIDRPIRICGMVKNEGEPGGGPFWIRDKNRNTSLQIIESAQIDMANSGQTEILKNATHFNPVDIVCGIRNYKGEKFNLLNYIDSRQGFIAEKTKAGKNLKALELPGLWNGAMAFWNTIFVEVPLETFNPVKTVNDLLKPTHQVT